MQVSGLVESDPIWESTLTSKSQNLWNMYLNNIFPCICKTMSASMFMSYRYYSLQVDMHVASRNASITPPLSRSHSNLHGTFGDLQHLFPKLTKFVVTQYVCVCARRTCAVTCKFTNEKTSLKQFHQIFEVMIEDGSRHACWGSHIQFACPYINVRVLNFCFPKLRAPQTRWCVSFDVFFQNTSCLRCPHGANKYIIHTVCILYI